MLGCLALGRALEIGATPDVVAVGEDRNGRFVFCIKSVSGDTATIERRDVDTGSLVGNSLEILRGLSAGDRVVTAGVSQVKDGMKVRAPQDGDDT